MKCAQTQHLYNCNLQKHEKKNNNGTWLPWQPGKTPKKRAKLCLCRPKYFKKGKWHKIEFFISFLNDMEL